jgi:oligopeptide/dipeptide ABC transporter ATP-binding protein
MLRLVGLSEHFYHYYPADLTASEQQRVGIARALATKPEFVVLDEPTSMLDPSARAEILELLQDIQKELGTAFIFISHDLTSVAKISHRIAIMYLGHIVEHAPTDIIMHSQRHPYSRALLSAVLFPDPARPPDPYVIEGEIPTAINPKPECPLYGRCPIREDACRSAVPPMVEVEPDHFSACRRWRDVAASTQA